MPRSDCQSERTVDPRPDALDIVPAPRTVVPQPGWFRWGPQVRLVADGVAADAAWLLHDMMWASGGLRLPVEGGASGTGPEVVFRLTEDDALAAEGYRLEVTPDRIELVAATPAGLGWATQTLRQLLPPEALRAAPTEGGTPALRWATPCCRVEDEPRFPMRGVMLDVARHYLPPDFLLRMVDLAALHKINLLHLHLTDDQGWRIDIPTWPALTRVGGWRAETARGPADQPHGYDGTPHGGYYPTATLREVVAYAARRHITVVPEIGLPGHVQAAVAAYPELGNGERPSVRTRWGGSDHTLAPGKPADRFLDDVLDVVLDIFPSPHIHLGGDKCPSERWRANQHARDFAIRAGLPSVDHLAGWFLRAAAARVTRAGRRAVMWDQALENGGVPPDVIIAVWRDWEEELAARALAAGHDILQCPTQTTYLDHRQSADADEPLGYPEVTTLDDVARFDPAPPDLPPVPNGGRVLGTQAQLWTEHLRSPRDVEYMAFPRLGALAEAAWSASTVRERTPFTDRLPAYLARLDALSVDYRPPSGPRAWQRGGTGDRAWPVARDEPSPGTT